MGTYSVYTTVVLGQPVDLFRICVCMHSDWLKLCCQSEEGERSIVACGNPHLDPDPNDGKLMVHADPFLSHLLLRGCRLDFRSLGHRSHIHYPDEVIADVEVFCLGKTRHAPTECSCRINTQGSYLGLKICNTRPEDVPLVELCTLN